MAAQRHTNPYPQPPHSVWDVVRWKFRLRAADAPQLPAAERAAFAPQRRAPDLTRLQRPDPARLQVTWIGHATFLLQFNGWNILTDPVWGEHCSPVPLHALRRLHAPGVAFEQLPEIHAVALSHSHYDHLDAGTIRRLGSRPRYWVPAGLGRWFQARGLTVERECHWWDAASVADGFTVHCVPAQHFSARTPFDRDRTLWCGWVFRTASHCVYFAGDTAYAPLFRDIRSRFGVPDVALLPIGAYNPRWVMQGIHMNPTEAVQAHVELGARQSLAGHWGTFQLTDEPVEEPPWWLRREMLARGLAPETFRPLALGETFVL